MSANSVQDLLPSARAMPGEDSAELYSDTAAKVCRRSLKQLLHETEDFQFSDDETVLDIGCGTGEASVLIKERIRSVKQFIGIDKSSEFIDFADTFRAGENILFKRMNAENEWPVEWMGKFSLVFSNYVFHWIKDHTKLLTSINKSLKPGGQLLVQFFHSALQTEDEMMAAKKAAQECGIMNEMQMAMMAIKKQMPVWKDEATYAKLISSLGFTVKKCKVVERHTKCSSKFERAGMTLTVSPFLLHVPKDKKLLFATKYVSNLKDPLTIRHNAITIHAVKD